MKQSPLYNIIEDAVIAEWKENFKNAEGSRLYQAIQKNEQVLDEALSNAKKENIKRLAESYEDFYESMIYHLAIEVLHIGIKIGIEIENSNYTE